MSSASAKAQTEKDKGNAAFKALDYPTAIGHYTAAILADPSNATYPLNRAAAYLKLGKNDDAARDCDRVLALDGKNVKALFRRGQARAAVGKFADAAIDFQQAVKHDPKNDAAKQELKKAQDALKSAPSKSTSRQPIDVSTPPPQSSSAPPTRRRIPITVVEPDTPSSSSPVAHTTTSPRPAAPGTNSDLLKPVSSRSLSSNPSPAPSSSTPSPAPAATQPKPAPQTFTEAKAARENAKPRGGIFRADGRHTLFTAPAPASTPSGSTPRPVPETLFAFLRIWESCTTEEERWDVVRQIPPARLPVLFKTSLEAGVLAPVIHTLHEALLAAPNDVARADVVRGHMTSLPRVPRFGTVALMLSDSERAEARAIWNALGRPAGAEGVELEMARRREDGSRRAWGV